MKGQELEASANCVYQNVGTQAYKNVLAQQEIVQMLQKQEIRLLDIDMLVPALCQEGRKQETMYQTQEDKNQKKTQLVLYIEAFDTDQKSDIENQN